MKYKIILIFVLAGTLLSCIRGGTNINDDFSTIVAYKHQYTGVDLKWRLTDTIGIFSKDINNSIFVTKSDELLSRALFSGEKLNYDESCIAYYPYKTDVIFNSGNISFVIPKEQIFVSGDAIEREISPSISVSYIDDNFIFDNIGAILEIRLFGKGDIKSIDFIAENHIVSGSGTYNIEAFESVMIESALASNMVSLTNISHSLTPDESAFNLVISAGEYIDCKIVVNGVNGEKTEIPLDEGIVLSCGSLLKSDLFEIDFTAI